MVVIHSETSSFKRIPKKCLKWIARSLMTLKLKPSKGTRKEREELATKEFIVYPTDAASEGNVIYG